MSNKSTNKIDKDNFIKFLSSATPRELNKLIEEKGKPPKEWCPIYFFRYPEQIENNGGTNNEQE